MTKRFPEATLKCEPIGWTTPGEGAISMQGWAVKQPQRKPTRGFQLCGLEFSLFGKEQSDKEPVTVCTIYYNQVQNMIVGVFHRALVTR